MPINLFNILNGVAGAKPPAGTRGGSQQYSPFPWGRGLGLGIENT